MGTVPSPYSPVAGDDATQARVLTWADAANYLLGNATSGGSKRALCVARQSVVQSLPTGGTGTAITLDVEDVDYDNGHSTVTNTSRYTAATTGWHDVFYGCSYAANVTGQRTIWLRKNGSDLAGSQLTVQAVSTAAVTTHISRSCKVFLTAGDFLEVFAYQDSGGALNTSITSTGSPHMMVEWRSN